MMNKKFLKLDLKLLKRDDLSLNAKILYTIIKDKSNLSFKNGETFSDEYDRIFCYLKTSDLITWLSICKRTLVKLYRELEKANMIKVKRQGQTLPNKIYLLDENGCFLKCKNCTSRSAKIAHQEVQKLHPIKTEVIKTEVIKEKKESKKKSAFYHTPKDEIIEFLLNTIIKIDLKHLKNDPLHHANKIYDHYQLNEWTLNNGKVIKDYNELELLLKSWNNREKDYLKNNVKEPEKKKRKIEWLDDYIEKLADLEKD